MDKSIVQRMKEDRAHQERKDRLRAVSMLRNAYNNHRALIDMFYETNGEILIDVARLFADKLTKDRGKILIAGNGGSAADAQHFAAEMTGRMTVERPPLPAIALTTDTSALTAIANDYGYDQVFERQLKALASPRRDVFVGISTSGKSENVVLAAERAIDLQMPVVAMIGNDRESPLGKLATYCIWVPSKLTPHVQEMHIFAIHSMLDILDRCYLGYDDYEDDSECRRSSPQNRS